MDETYYWGALEYRICREFAGRAERSMRYLWCDGLLPVEFLLNDRKPRVVGQTWICSGPKQEQWRFTLLLPYRVGSRGEIDWAALLPAENLTRWLAVDPASKCIEIEPGAAVAE